MREVKVLIKKPFVQYFLFFLIVATYGVLFLEVIKYPGFFKNYFFVDAKIIFAASIFLLTFLNTKTKLMPLVFKINNILLVVLTALYLGLYLLEGANYTNYVLSKFGFHLDGLILPVLFGFFIFLVQKFKDEVVNFGKKSKVYPVFVLLIVYFVVRNLSYSLEMGVSRTSYILFHLGNTYDEKMTYQWGVFYDFMSFIKNNTPLDSTIIIPPEEGAWLMGTGEPNFVRAFLYPRTIVPETLIISDEKIESYNDNTYILISWGQEACRPDPDCHGWPKQKIKTFEIIYKKPDSSDVAEIKKDTIYDPDSKTYVYGLIKPLVTN